MVMSSNFSPSQELVQHGSNRNFSALFRCAIPSSLKFSSELPPIRSLAESNIRVGKSYFLRKSPSEPVVYNCMVTEANPFASMHLFNWSTTTISDSLGVVHFLGSETIQHADRNSKCWKKTMKVRVGEKRKATEPLSAISEMPTKVFINEKRMSACLSQLNLENNNMDGHPDLEEDPWYSMQQHRRDVNFANVVENVKSETNCQFVLYKGLNLDIRRRTRILPEAITDEIKKPMMQVVLWKPPLISSSNLKLMLTSDVERESQSLSTNTLQRADEYQNASELYSLSSGSTSSVEKENHEMDVESSC